MGTLNLSGAKPSRTGIAGRFAALAPLDAGLHTDALWEQLAIPGSARLFDYLADEPFPDRDTLAAALAAKAASEDPLFFAILVDGRAAGWAAYLRIEPRHRAIEVGHILFTPALQRTRAATEAMYLMVRHVFEDLGYRRYEWKCDTRNLPSKRAAVRLGFTFEGIFRQHMIAKGQNRDTAWFSMLDSEWPARKAAFERWLDEDNFLDGRQRQSLESIRQALTGTA
jgi:RimJ/RimL family protein N-acetyltransferase